MWQSLTLATLQLNLHTRSVVAIHDLDSKKGSLLNGVEIRGETRTLSEDVNEVKLGACPKIIRIIWHPVVLSFSFTSKELRADPWAKLRSSLEQLDIKYSAEYEKLTSHVVTKKRNTPKGLQALINGKYIVTDSFISGIVNAAAVADGAEDGAQSALEEDFEGAWPKAIDHLPPRSEEPVDRPPKSYAPDARRQEVFDGYTFVFYEKKQYENLFPAITYGKGKALLKEVIPRETEIDDFVRYVKGVAGEKGLGSFEDGSEGKGVVVVRYMPAKGAESEWFAQFLTSFALRLDHRPIDQREFLEAILDCDASTLRRPLEEESQSRTHNKQNAGDTVGRAEANNPPSQQQEEQQQQQQPPQEEAPQASAPPTRRGRARRGVATRFRGFDFGADGESDAPVVDSPVIETPAMEASTTQPPEAADASQDSLFVSQQENLNHTPAETYDGEVRTTRRTRKRHLSPLPEHDDSALMDDIAPTAAAAKRRRIEAGQTPVPLPPDPQPNEDHVELAAKSPPEVTIKTETAKGKSKKAKEGDAILELARQRREEAEALAAAERKTLTDLQDDEIDYAAIRALHIIEDCDVHFPGANAAPGGTRGQEIADGRWDPRWNGRKNFKRFRKQGEQGGRPAPRIIIALEEVRPKEYGIGDDYWLENNDSSSRRKKDSQRESQTQQPKTQLAPAIAREKVSVARRRGIVAADSSDEDEEEDDIEDTDAMVHDTFVTQPEPPRSRIAKAAEKTNSLRSQSQSQTQTQTRSSQAASSGRAGKRAAPTSPAKERAAKRTRRGFEAKDSDESDDSEDELKFRFGKRK
ncbi:hypothetical protein B0T24DRAFT_537867 [Lasiosphaeria ovina]|uniref:Nibrin second BRCT domain-containing protein n=1 Tax=Lasiosphaeria ovina TaxID=92902 RepID=A0AAE0MZF8_9PEZI|nr:hypothetical protein B0T24DRAFT_537867 [Lasiosphaeria ovina]